MGRVGILRIYRNVGIGMTEYALVPVGELEKLEAARVALLQQPYDMASLIKLSPGTGIMWHVANRKWKKLIIDDDFFVKNS